MPPEDSATKLLIRPIPTNLPDHAPDRAQETGAGPARPWDEQVPPGRDGTLLAVVPIPGTGTSLAIVGYAITTSAASPPARPAATRTRRPQGSGLRLDRGRRRVWTDGREIELTFREFELLAFLSAHPATVFTRADLIERVWHRAVARDSRDPWTCTSAGSGTSSVRATVSAWSPNTASATSSAHWRGTTSVRAGIPRVAHWLIAVKRAPGSVKLRTGGESPRPVRSQRTAEPVKFRDRR